MNLKDRLVAAGAGGIILAVAVVIGPQEGEVQKTYRDPIGIPTACFGQTGPTIRMGQTYTAEQCTDLLVKEVQEKLAGVDACTPGLPDRMRKGFTSFAYNVGVPAYCDSTAAKKARAKDYAGACAELSRWVNAGGKPLPGLVKRRAEERAICEGRVAA